VLPREELLLTGVLMSDRETARVFERIFKKLGSDPTPQHRSWALELWRDMSCFDFHYSQLSLREELLALDLARFRIDAKYPEDGEVLFFGPPGEDAR
jgi:hypothetical protein